MIKEVARNIPLAVTLYKKYKASQVKYDRKSFSWIMDRMTGGTVLDIGGVGGGKLQTLTRELLNQDYSVTEVDIRECQTQHENLEFINDDVLCFDFDKQFDIVLAIHVLQHVGMPYKNNKVRDNNGDIKLADKLFRWLRPGGTVFIEVPTANNSQILTLVNELSYRIYTYESVKKLFNKFEYIDSYTYNGARLSRKLVKGARSTVMMFRKPIENFIELGTERKLLDNGHNFNIVEFNGKSFAYCGNVRFEEVKVYTNNYHYPLTSIDRCRTATAVVVDNQVNLFCATSLIKDSFDYQKILHYKSNDGYNFKFHNGIVAGSAPFIFKHDKYYLYYHRKTTQHEIRVIKSDDINNFEGEGKLIMTADHSFSMPSMCYLNGKFWLTCEEMVNKKWRTMLYSSNNPTSGFKEEGILLDAPCVYQHKIGDKYFITYSRQETNKKWNIFMKEGL